MSGGNAELAADLAFVEDLPGDKLGKRYCLAEEGRVPAPALGGGNRRRAAGQRGLPVAAQPVRVRSDCRGPRFGVARMVREKVVEPSWQRRQADAKRPAVALAARVQ